MPGSRPATSRYSSRPNSTPPSRTFPKRSSNTYTYERYVRLESEFADKLVNAKGIFWRIFQLLADQTGIKWEFHGDNEDVVGKMHRLRLYPESATKLLSTHEYGKQLKHYYMKNVDAQEGPTDSPKFGVLVNKSLNDGDAIPWEDRGAVTREIEETVVNALDWADVPSKPDESVFVEDLHFTLGPSDVDVTRFEDPTPEIEAEQEALVHRMFRDLSDGAEDLAFYLSTDGGTRYDEAADDLGVSTSTVYRWLTELGRLVRNDGGELHLRSRKLEQVLGSIDDIAREIEPTVRNGADRIAKLVRMSEREAEESALSRWLNEYAVEVAQEAGEKRLRFDTLLSWLQSSRKPKLVDVLLEGYDAWASAGRDPVEFLELWYVADVDGQRREAKIGNDLPNSRR